MEQNKEVKVNREQVALALVRIMWRKGEINDSWYANTLRTNGILKKECDDSESR